MFLIESTNSEIACSFDKALMKALPIIAPLANCEAFVNELNKASFHIERNANPKILFMDLSLKANELLNMKELATHGA